MVEVVVFAEGQTEESFIKLVVAPALRGLDIFLKPQTLRTSREARGGAVTLDRLKFYARNALRQYPKAILTTLIDLYGLDSAFPGFNDARKLLNPRDKATLLERNLAAAIVDHVGCRYDRFIPHIQPYEFEGLLFSDVDALAATEPGWQWALVKLQEIRVEFETPEHINDSFETKPSKRLEEALKKPGYHKTRHGPLAAEKITLAVIERECPHFHGWMEALRGLAR